jgi:hypothetical protein
MRRPTWNSHAIGMQEVTMSKTRLALAASALVLTSVAALAQDAPSYESRGYGGPLYIGPNFHQGGQMSPPTYDGSRSVERYRAPQRLDRVERMRNNNDDDVKAAKKTEPSKESAESKEAKAESENSSIVSMGADADKKPADTPKTDTAKADSGSENSTIASVASSATAKADPVKAAVTKADTDGSGKPTGCKRYFPTVGQTLSVPCD